MTTTSRSRCSCSTSAAWRHERRRCRQHRAGKRIFTEFKGALTEQYVCQQLISIAAWGWPYYWSAESSTGRLTLRKTRGRWVRNGGQGGREPARKKLARVQAGESAGESRALLALALPPARLDAQRPAYAVANKGAVGLAEWCALRAKTSRKVGCVDVPQAPA